MNSYPVCEICNKSELYCSGDGEGDTVVLTNCLLVHGIFEASKGYTVTSLVSIVIYSELHHTYYQRGVLKVTVLNILSGCARGRGEVL